MDWKKLKPMEEMTPEDYELIEYYSEETDLERWLQARGDDLNTYDPNEMLVVIEEYQGTWEDVQPYGSYEAMMRDLTSDWCQ